MKRNIAIGLVLLAIVIAFPLFWGLDKLPLRKWDEARQALSAFEMLHNHNWLVNYVHGAPDMWSTKPPLFIWCEALSIRLLGLNDLAVRLPAAVAAFATCLLVYLFFAKRFGRPVLGFICALVLATSRGFVTLHAARTGDYDALLTLFTTASALSYFTYLDTGRSRYLFYTFILLTLGVLTKSISALLFVPGLFLCTLFQRKLGSIFKDKTFYVGLGSFIVIVASFYLLREHYNPGYLKAVYDNELGGRYTNAMEHNGGVFLYYYNCAVHFHFNLWYWLLVPGILAGVFSQDMRLRQVAVLALTLSITFFLIISLAATKLYWYAMPMYPFLAILVGMFVFYIYSVVSRISGSFGGSAAGTAILVLIFFYPYRLVLQSNAAPAYIPASLKEGEDMAVFLKGIADGGKPLPGKLMPYTSYEPAVDWYIIRLNYTHRPVIFVAENKIEKGDRVIAYQSDAKKYLEARYFAMPVSTYNDVTIYQVNGTKE